MLPTAGENCFANSRSTSSSSRTHANGPAESCWRCCEFWYCSTTRAFWHQLWWPLSSQIKPQTHLNSVSNTTISLLSHFVCLSEQRQRDMVTWWMCRWVARETPVEFLTRALMNDTPYIVSAEKLLGRQLRLRQFSLHSINDFSHYVVDDDDIYHLWFDYYYDVTEYNSAAVCWTSRGKNKKKIHAKCHDEGRWLRSLHIILCVNKE